LKKSKAKKTLSGTFRAVTQRLTRDRRQETVEVEMEVCQTIVQTGKASSPSREPNQAEDQNKIELLQRKIDTCRTTKLTEKLEIAFTCPEFDRHDKVPITKIDATELPKPKTTVLRRLRYQQLKTWFFDTRAEIGIPPSSYVFFIIISLLLGSSPLLVVGLL